MKNIAKNIAAEYKNGKAEYYNTLIMIAFFLIIIVACVIFSISNTDKSYSEAEIISGTVTSIEYTEGAVPRKGRVVSGHITIQDDKYGEELTYTMCNCPIRMAEKFTNHKTGDKIQTKVTTTYSTKTDQVKYRSIALYEV